jgi:uncharacterized protein YdcH (DUF465 family)
MNEDKIKEILLKESDEFRKVFEEHQRCEQVLAELQSRGFLSDEEKVQEKLLKKKKLGLKDEMYRMILEYEKKTGDRS